MGVVLGTSYLCFSLAIWQGSHFLVSNRASFQAIIVVELVIARALFALSGIQNHFETFAKAFTALQKALETIDLSSDIDSTSDGGQKLDTLVGDIELKNVTFFYPSRPDKMVLKNVSLKFPAGNTTALVGSSGSGKSSIVDLIERFYDPIEGQVLLDNVDLKTLNVRKHRQKIGVVNQHPGLFAESVYENIRHGLIGTPFGNAPPEVQERLIKAAAVAANADECISKLPEGYQTLVGEKGSFLSGGMKQRVAIARALVSDRKMLLLDEATSAIDSEAEKKIVAFLDESKAKRTTIVVAHRLSTIKSADNIVLLAHGVVVEQGTHNELMALGGVYAEMVNIGDVVEDEVIEEAIIEGKHGKFAPLFWANK